jgi:hypothetical protein
MKTNRFLLVMLALLSVTLVQNAQAFYNPSTGRWLSRDPIGETGGLNVYGFVRNTSVNAFDILGLQGTIPGGPYPLPTPKPPYDRNQLPTTKIEDMTWRVCCQPYAWDNWIIHCDLRYGPCDKDSSNEYPVTLDTGCCNKSIKSHIDMSKCLRKQTVSAGWYPGNNCQSTSWDAIKACCAKTKWRPSMYAVIPIGDLPPPCFPRLGY